MAWKAYEIFAIIVTTIVLLIVVAATVIWARMFLDSVVLPNGMAVERSFDFTIDGRHDLVSLKRGVTLARDVESVCFNDRYIQVWSNRRTDFEYFDGEADTVLIDDDMDAIRALSKKGGGCNGYYTSMLEPEYLNSGNKGPYIPSCSWRNLENKALKHREWFDRPCLER